MQGSKFISAILAAVLTIGSAGAFARDRNGDGIDDGHRRGTVQPQTQVQAQRQWQGQRQYTPRQYAAPAPVYNAPRYAQQNYYRHSQPAYVYNAPRYVNAPRYYANAPRYWSRGDYLPYGWRSNYAYVNNWGAYNLYAPPAGYGWVQSDTGDFLLVALATGLIANLLLNR